VFVAGLTEVLRGLELNKSESLYGHSQVLPSVDTCLDTAQWQTCHDKYRDCIAGLL
jgi:hypothetical protein